MAQTIKFGYGLLDLFIAAAHGGILTGGEGAWVKNSRPPLRTAPERQAIPPAYRCAS